MKKPRRSTRKEKKALVMYFTSKKTKQQSKYTHPKLKNQFQMKKLRRSIRKEEKKKYQERRKGISNIFHKQENQTKLIYPPKTESPIPRDQERNTEKEEYQFQMKKPRRSIKKEEKTNSRDQERNTRKEECIPIPNKEAKKKYQERRKDISNIFHKQKNQTKLIYLPKNESSIPKDQERNTEKEEYALVNVFSSKKTKQQS
ncbi:22410_t:CDS:2 [Cetraspora pellucida]|uniref:22410_t:CDS:1 n=1 Tax=Cetraspora pellucida TaxID=1433469 RepID=A0A9N9BDJ6_9GLOM|nr:22410_t:CDS:2 [Cetraspora pellucida]